VTVVPGDRIEFADLPGRASGDPLEAADSSSSVRIVRLARGAQRMAHRHPLSEEVIYVERGSGAVYLDGSFHPVAPGDVIHIPPGAAHATVPDPGEEMVLIAFFPHPQLAKNHEETDIDVMAVATDD